MTYNILIILFQRAAYTHKLQLLQVIKRVRVGGSKSGIIQAI